MPVALYRRAIHHWERNLAERDRTRAERPFEWGLEWLGMEGIDGIDGIDGRQEDPGHAARRHAAQALEASDAYFSYHVPRDFRLAGETLTFTSPLSTPYPENNTVWARYLRAGKPRRAVVILPQWNADPEGHVALGRMLNWFGIAALRLSLPYHDRRTPAGLERAEYHVSSNIGRTIHACRQAVVDTRACLDWLEGRGYQALGILGSSLGSCIALLAAAHDRRLRAAVFNHIATYFADVVWTGISTRHVRRSLERHVQLQELRRCWSVISPASYLGRLEDRGLASLLVWATHDLSFLPKYSRQVLAHYRRRRLPHRTLAIPCGHYSLARAPFKYIDAAGMCWFLHRNLRHETASNHGPG